MKLKLRTAFFLLTLLSVYAINAQNDVKGWVYEVEDFEGRYGNVDTNRISIQVEKDTVINGETVQKLVFPFIISAHALNHTGVEYVYEDNGTVYKWNDQTQIFDTLYNFNLDAGESWEIEPNSFVRIDSLRFIQINGESKKQLFVTYEDLNTSNSPHNSIITEGFGDHSFYFNYLRFESAPLESSYYLRGLISVITEDGLIESISDTASLYELKFDDCTPEINLVFTDSICPNTPGVILADSDDFSSTSLKRIYSNKPEFSYSNNGLSSFAIETESIAIGDSIEVFYVFDDKCGNEYTHRHVIHSFNCEVINCEINPGFKKEISDLKEICGNYGLYTILAESTFDLQTPGWIYDFNLSGENILLEGQANSVVFQIQVSDFEEGNSIPFEFSYKDHCGIERTEGIAPIVLGNDCSIFGYDLDNLGINDLLSDSICRSSGVINLDTNSNAPVVAVYVDEVETDEFDPAFFVAEDTVVISFVLSNFESFGTLKKDVIIKDCVIDDCMPDINLIVVDSICELTNYISLATVEDFTEGSLKSVFGGNLESRDYYDSLTTTSDYGGVPFSHVVYDVFLRNTEDSLTFTYTFEDKCGGDFIYNHVIRVVPCEEIDCSLKDEERLMFSDAKDDTICGNYNDFLMFVAAEPEWENYFSPFLDSISGELVDVLIFGGGIGFGLDLSESNESDLVSVDLHYKDHCGVSEIVEKTFVIGDKNCPLDGRTLENTGIDSLFAGFGKVCSNSSEFILELNSDAGYLFNVTGEGVRSELGDYYFNPSLFEYGDSTEVIFHFSQGTLTKKVFIDCVIEGLDYQEGVENFTIFPNPSTGDFTIEHLNNIDANSVLVYSSLGEVVLEKGFTSDEIRVSGLISGVYMVELRGEKTSFIQRVIIE